MRRVAWFTPVPPVRSGIARYSLELFPQLASDWAIDLFVESPEGVCPEGAAALRSAHDFVWAHAKTPYELVVYQLGNSPCHDYMWPYLVRYPGLVVLHDGQLHHARARSLLQDHRAEDYRTEFRYNHPDADPRVAELGVTGLLGPLTYFWPMRRVVLERARAVVVHNAWLAQQLCLEVPTTTVKVIEMGVPDLRAAPREVHRIRERHGVDPEGIVLALFGTVTPEKRVSQVLRAVASCRHGGRPVHVLLCGELVGHYDPRAEAAALGLDDIVTVTGYIDDAELPSYIAAADLCVCLRWPSSRETSASWLRCLAARKPTVVTDLVHHSDIPALDPRDWSIAGYPAGRDLKGEEVSPACVTIDILDEDHSLTLALRRLINDPELRRVIADAGRELWRRRFTLDAMAKGYHVAMRETMATTRSTETTAALPAHLTADGKALLHTLLDEMHVPSEL